MSKSARIAPLFGTALLLWLAQLRPANAQSPKPTESPASAESTAQPSSRSGAHPDSTLSSGASTTPARRTVADPPVAELSPGAPPDESLRQDIGDGVELSIDRGNVSLSAGGGLGRARDDADTRARQAQFDARAAVPLYSRLSYRRGQIDGTFVLAHFGVGTFLPSREFTEQDQVFFRSSVGASAAILTPGLDIYSLYLGAAIAESEATLSEPRVRPLALAIATYRFERGLALIYGAGFTYHLGRGFPLPFLGLNWQFADDWRLTAVLPAFVYFNYQPSEQWRFSVGPALDGDSYGYERANAAGDVKYTSLKVSRFRLLWRTTFGGRLDPQWRADVGVQRETVDRSRGDDADQIGDERAFAGLFARLSFIYRWGF